MKPCHKILFQSFVKPFYRENAGTFILFIILLFCIIGKVDGAELFAYHLSLATGMLQNFSFLLIVLFTWLIYTRKFAVFVSKVIYHPQFSFLHIYNQLSKAKRFRLFLVIEVWLLMPVLLYYLFLLYVAFSIHLYLPVVIIGLYLLLLSCIAALYHVLLLENIPSGSVPESASLFIKWSRPASYKSVLLFFVAKRQLFVWSGIKLFTCGLLYLIVRNNNTSNYDISMAFIFYTFGMLANGVLIFRIRAFEEMYLHFYKGLAVLLIKRFLDYCFIYVVLFIPELFTIILLSPKHLYSNHAIGFMLSGFSMLLFMNSITFLDDFTMKDYLKILFAIFVISCICFTTVGLVVLSSLFAVSAMVIFINRYYKFEKIYNATPEKVSIVT